VQDVMRDKRGFDLVIAEAFIEEAVYTFAEHFNVSVKKIMQERGVFPPNLNKLCSTKTLLVDMLYNLLSACM
jgi:hypothetical protein